MSEAARDVRWIRWFLDELGFPQPKPTPLYADNSSAILNAEDPTRRTQKTKHIRIRDFFIRECVAAKEILVVKVNTDDLSADANTKPLGGQKFTAFRSILQGFTI